MENCNGVVGQYNVEKSSYKYYSLSVDIVAVVTGAFTRYNLLDVRSKDAQDAVIGYTVCLVDVIPLRHV